MNQRTLIISATALIAATALGIVLWYVNMPKDTNTPPVTQTTNQTEKTPTVVSSGELMSGTASNVLKKIGENTYKSEIYEFEISLDSSWHIKVLESDYNSEKNFSFVFTKDQSDIRAILFPRGGYGYGLPFQKPIKQVLSFGGRSSTMQSWELNDKKILTLLFIYDYPETWNKENRFEIVGQKIDIDEFVVLLKDIRFID